MTGKIVNLNQFRKQKNRVNSTKQADENTVKFGLNKAEKQLNRARSEKADRDLSGLEHDDT